MNKWAREATVRKRIGRWDLSARAAILGLWGVGAGLEYIPILFCRGEYVVELRVLLGPCELRLMVWHDCKAAA